MKAVFVHHNGVESPYRRAAGGASSNRSLSPVRRPVDDTEDLYSPVSEFSESTGGHKQWRTGPGLSTEMPGKRRSAESVEVDSKVGNRWCRRGTNGRARQSVPDQRYRQGA